MAKSLPCAFLYFALLQHREKHKNGFLNVQKTYIYIIISCQTMSGMLTFQQRMFSYFQTQDFFRRGKCAFMQQSGFLDKIYNLGPK